nr:glycosyltransferase [uncultured Lachnoanaerobaculum sp.]
MGEHNSIPKIIHYCWFGKNPMSEKAEKCIASWKEKCPEYRIIEWNEENFDIQFNNYVREAYSEKKWAFVSDVARLYALVNYGGIYMDTDVEVITSLDILLKYEAFAGFESDTQIQTGIMGCCKNHKLFIEFLSKYNNLHFVRVDGSMDLTTNATRLTDICNKYGFKKNNTLQDINGLTVLPKDFLSPKDYNTGEIKITDNTCVIHHFEASWHGEEDIYISKLANKFKIPIWNYIAKFIGITKYQGIKKALCESFQWIKRR